MGTVVDTRTVEDEGAVMRQVVHLITATGVEVTTVRFYRRVSD